MKYTKLDIPVALICYNRPEHTKAVLNALKKAGVRNLYLFFDAPKKESHQKEVDAARALVSMVDWTDPVITFREENYGLAKSIVSAADTIFEQHDRLILLEDDCVPQEFFFDFMYKSLSKYEADKRVFGVSGYSIPIPDEIHKGYDFDAYFFPRIGSWGWATWKDRWELRDPDLLKSYHLSLVNGIDLNQGGTDVPVMITDFLRGRLKDVWTLHWILAAYNNKSLFLYPVKSHIDNIGMDGTGIHCGTTDRFNTIIAENQPEKFPEPNTVDRDIYGLFRSYYDKQAPIAVNNPKDKTTSPKGLNIVHISARDYDTPGLYAGRLHRALLAEGHQSTFLCAVKRTNTERTVVLTDFPAEEPFFAPESVDYDSFPFLNKSEQSARLTGQSGFKNRFAGGKVDFALERIRQVQEADVIHLHDCESIFDYGKLKNAFSGKKIVRSVYDMSPFTGGCFFPGSCSRWKEGCGTCPLINSRDPVDQTHRRFQEKKEFYSANNVTFITPYFSLTKELADSAMVNTSSTGLIPHGIPAEVFKQFDKAHLRSLMKLPSYDKLILFYYDGSEQCKSDVSMLLKVLSSLHAQGDDRIGIGGLISPDVPLQPFEPNTILHFGQDNDEQRRALILAAADILFLPHTELNNLHLTAEAFAVGTAVILERTPELTGFLSHKENGWFYQVRSEKQFVEGLHFCIDNSQKMQESAVAMLKTEPDSNFISGSIMPLYKKQTEKAASARDIYESLTGKRMNHKKT